MVYGVWHIKQYRVRGTEKEQWNCIIIFVWIPTAYGEMKYLRCSYWFITLCNAIQFENWLKYIIHSVEFYLLFAVWWFRDSSLTLSAFAYLSTVYWWHWKWTRQISVSTDVLGCNKIHTYVQYNFDWQCMHIYAWADTHLSPVCMYIVLHEMQCIILRFVAHIVYTFWTLHPIYNKRIEVHRKAEHWII